MGHGDLQKTGVRCVSSSLKRNDNKDVKVLEIHVKEPDMLKLQEKSTNTLLKTKENKMCTMMKSGTRRFANDRFVVRVLSFKKK